MMRNRPQTWVGVAGFEPAASLRPELSAQANKFPAPRPSRTSEAIERPRSRRLTAAGGGSPLPFRSQTWTRGVAC